MTDSSSQLSNAYQSLFAHNAWLLPIIVVLIAWTLVAKGLGLWRAAQNRHRAWFVAMLILNTLGILELIYLASHRRRK